MKGDFVLFKKIHSAKSKKLLHV